MAAPAQKSQELQIAEQFCQAYSGALTSGNAGQLAGFYGPDSVAAYDGNIQNGPAAIAAAFINPRVSGGPALVKYNTIDAQFTPTQQLLILCTGESNKPAGRFTQLFLLSSAGGGMYIRADVCRFSAGAVPQNVAGDPTGMGSGIVNAYYSMYASNKPGLLSLYRANSQLAFEKLIPPIATGQSIEIRVKSSPQPDDNGQVFGMPSGTMALETVDALQVVNTPGQAVAAGVLLLTSGSMTLAGESHSLPFVQCFFLIGDASGAYVSNDVFRFNLS